jgi:hypothetical protein
MKGFFVLIAGLAATAMSQGNEGIEPGPAHKQLAKRVGEYATATKFWTGLDAPPAESKGAAKIAETLGGRFLLEENSGTLLGQPFTGLRLYGYNNLSKQYESVWTWTESTGMVTMRGTSKDEGKTVTYAAAYNREPGAKQTFQVVVRQVNDDSFVAEISGDKAKMETTYTRKK